MRKRPFAVILGTRPEIIKLAPIIRYLQKSKLNYFMIHTGQHYSYRMDRVFFKDMELPPPKYHFSLNSNSLSGHGEHTANMMMAIEQVLLKENPRVVFVQGDTNTVLAGALAASKLKGVHLAHVEAGLRSYDRQMPEEINRILADHVSDLLFPPTIGAASVLKAEGIASKKIFVVGNTIVDAVRQNLKIAEKKLALKDIVPFAKKKYLLMTLHRQENVDNAEHLKKIIHGIQAVMERFKMPVVFPIHPRTQKRLQQFKINLPSSVKVIEPTGFLEFIVLEKNAALLLTDSGGVQEEGCILKVPCVTLRTTTERPETIKVGASLLAGHDAAKILKSARILMKRPRNWKNPFGDGHSGERIVKLCDRAFA